MLLSVSDARERLLIALSPLETERISIATAGGRVLAEPILSPRDYPPFSNSSMDGFAVRAQDVYGVHPDKGLSLQVVSDIPAGKSPQVVIQSGQAARIMTGAPLPAGANAVVPVEMTDFNDRHAGVAAPPEVKIFKAVEVGAYVRNKGEDIRTNEQVLSSGEVLRPQDIGLLAMLGKEDVEVFRQPLVGILSTGDELLPLGAPIEPGKIYESNAYTLQSLIHEAGGLSLHLGIAPDRADAVKERLDRAVSERVDLILSSAGVSVGAFDFVRSVVESSGELDFWRVNMRPGKPLAFGHYRGIPFVGLPGNPVSAFAGFEVFIRPAMYKLMGVENWQRERRRGVLQEEISSDGRESYLRAIVTTENGEWHVRLTGHQGSGNQFSLVRANAFMIVPAGVKSLPIGAEVEIWPF